MTKRKSAPLTKAHLDGAVSIIRGDVRAFVQHFNRSQGGQNERLDTINTKLDAIMEAVATRREMHNLVREIKGQGLAIDESKIFVV